MKVAYGAIALGTGSTGNPRRPVRFVGIPVTPGIAGVVAGSGAAVGPIEGAGDGAGDCAGEAVAAGVGETAGEGAFAGAAAETATDELVSTSARASKRRAFMAHQFVCEQRAPLAYSVVLASATVKRSFASPSPAFEVSMNALPEAECGARPRTFPEISTSVFVRGA